MEEERSSKAGFNNVLYHGNTSKQEPFVSPSKESLRRYPFDQKRSDRKTTSELRRHREDGGRSATWLLQRVQVPADGAFWVKGQQHWKPARQVLKWPATRAGTSGRAGSQVRKKTRHKKRSANVVFEKLHGLMKGSGNVRFLSFLFSLPLFASFFFSTRYPLHIIHDLPFFLTP